MSETNNNEKLIKILTGVIVVLSIIILLSGILYIHNMKTKINELEKKQEEILKEEVVQDNATSMQSIPEQTDNTKTEVQEKPKNSNNNTKPLRNNKKIKKQTNEINRTGIEKAIDDTINKIDNTKTEDNSNSNDFKSDE